MGRGKFSTSEFHGVNRKKISLRAFLIFIFSFFSTQISFSQNSTYARKILETLSSSEFHGRGYVEGGMEKAANFIAAQLDSLGLKEVDENRFQSFSFPVNTFPGNIQVNINDQELEPGRDFIIESSSGSVQGIFHLSKPDDLVFDDREVVLIFDTTVITIDERSQLYGQINHHRKSRPVLVVRNKLTWSVSTHQQEFPLIEVLHRALPKNPSTIQLQVEAIFEKDFEAKNVLAMVEGTAIPDSFLVFTAHFDHLGKMGKEAIFPGASDNASGTAMLLDLAAHYKANPPEYSVVFIAFAAEEAGLIGSKYFTENPIFPLEKIKFLINLDLMGSASDGIAIVNGNSHPEYAEIMGKINEEHHFVDRIKLRGQAANSDHYWFSENGVPAFFIYTIGEISAYHDVFDVSHGVPFTQYNEVFKLITYFAAEL